MLTFRNTLCNIKGTEPKPTYKERQKGLALLTTYKLAVGEIGNILSWFAVTVKHQEKIFYSLWPTGSQFDKMIICFAGDHRIFLKHFLEFYGVYKQL